MLIKSRIRSLLTEVSGGVAFFFDVPEHLEGTQKLLGDCARPGKAARKKVKAAWWLCKAWNMHVVVMYNSTIHDSCRPDCLHYLLESMSIKETGTAPLLLPSSSSSSVVRSSFRLCPIVGERPTRSIRWSFLIWDDLRSFYECSSQHDSAADHVTYVWALVPL